MESRKRPLPDMEEPVISKKRILTGANGSPHVNGDIEQDDEAFGEKLEVGDFSTPCLLSYLAQSFNSSYSAKKQYIVE